MAPQYIVGYDGTPASRAALEFTRELARGTGAGVLATHVYATLSPLYISPHATAPPSAIYAEAAEAGRAGADRLLERVPQDVGRRAVQSGSIPSELHALARAEKAALLAVGVTHRGPLGRLVPGSTAERLVHASPCPVLVVPQSDDVPRIATIGVAYDGRAEARRALRVAATLARRIGASLRLIAAIEPWPSDLGLSRATDELDEAIGAQVDGVVESAAGALRRRGLEVQTQTLRAQAGPGIVRSSEDVDLLVTGSRGYGPLRAVLLGGASRYIVDHALCPVLVIPRGAATALVADDVAAAAVAA